MKSFIFMTFFFLGWAFYEMSGGADFKAQDRVVKTKTEDHLSVPEVEVTRAESPSGSALVPISKPLVNDIEANLIATSLIETPASGSVEGPVFASGAEELGKALATETPAADEPKADLRTVAGSRVNMRHGPGLHYGIMDSLIRGTETEVLATAHGWARVRVIETGRTGWMAVRLLSAPSG